MRRWVYRKQLDLETTGGHARADPAVLRLPVEVGRTADPMPPGQLAECDRVHAFSENELPIMLWKTHGR